MIHSTDIDYAIEEEDNVTMSENQQNNASEELSHDEIQNSADIDEDGGHFNRNKDNQLNFKDAEEMQVPQRILDHAFDIGLGVETEQPSSGMS